MVAICASIEAEIAELDAAEAAEFLQEMGLEEPGLDRVIHAGYRLLNLQTLLYRGSPGSSRLDHTSWRYRTACGWENSYRF